MLSIAMILMDYRDSRLSPIRTTLNILLHPLLYTVDVPFRTSAYIADFFRDQSKIIEENRKLNSLVKRYAVRDQKYHSIAQENIRFRKQLNASPALEERFKLAEILSVSRDQHRNTVTIDKGAVDGVYQGQVVLSGQSIYGQIFEVASNTAVILKLTDTKHAIPVRNNRTGLGAIA
ncbi:MAG: rod shape-determining protein MreC, partial [Leucothrix sp.]